MTLIFIIGYIFISLSGTLFHFIYDLSNHNKIVGIFTAVNESTWEHIKLALTPYFIWSIVDGFFYGLYPNYFIAKLIGLLTIILIMPTIFYGYRIFVKKPILFIDISNFFITVFLSQYFTYLVLNTKPVLTIASYISLVLLFILFGAYLLLTIYPLKNFLFKDPITNKYGLAGHNHNKTKK